MLAPSPTKPRLLWGRLVPKQGQQTAGKCGLASHSGVKPTWSIYKEGFWLLVLLQSVRLTVREDAEGSQLEKTAQARWE